jgi:hypothetical protein
MRTGARPDSVAEVAHRFQPPLPIRWCRIGAVGLAASYGPNWNSSLLGLEGVEIPRVLRAVEMCCHDPDHPSLNFGPIDGNRSGRLYSIRASQEIRVLLAREEKTAAFLEAGHACRSSRARYRRVAAESEAAGSDQVELRLEASVSVPSEVGARRKTVKPASPQERLQASADV